MSNKENHFRDVLVYDVLDKEKFFFVITKLLKSTDQHINFFKSGMSMKEYFEKETDSTRGVIKDINKSENSYPGFYFLLVDSLLWVFLGDVDNAEETTAIIKRYFNKAVSSIRITNKEFLESLFIDGFSDNLLEIHVAHDEYDDFIELTSVYGSQVNYSSEYEQIINNDLKITSYSLQPMNETNVITFRDENSIEFSKHMGLTEIIRIINKISSYYIRYIKRMG